MENNNINPTHAKDIALHFYDRKEWRVGGKHATSPFGKSVNQAKKLLGYGYTKEEIIDVIDYIFDKTDVNVYSFGYVNYVINEILDKVKVMKMKEQETQTTMEVMSEQDESTTRNKRKLERLNRKSNIGEEYNFDMFKEQ